MKKLFPNIVFKDHKSYIAQKINVFLVVKEGNYIPLLVYIRGCWALENERKRPQRKVGGELMTVTYS